MDTIHMILALLLIIIIIMLVNKSTSWFGIMSADGNNYLWNNGTMVDQDSSSPVYFYGQNFY